MQAIKQKVLWQEIHVLNSNLMNSPPDRGCLPACSLLQRSLYMGQVQMRKKRVTWFRYDCIISSKFSNSFAMSLNLPPNLSRPYSFHKNNRKALIQRSKCFQVEGKVVIRLRTHSSHEVLSREPSRIGFCGIISIVS